MLGSHLTAEAIVFPSAAVKATPHRTWVMLCTGRLVNDKLWSTLLHHRACFRARPALVKTHNESPFGRVPKVVHAMATPVQNRRNTSVRSPNSGEATQLPPNYTRLCPQLKPETPKRAEQSHTLIHTAETSQNKQSRITRGETEPDRHEFSALPQRPKQREVNCCDVCLCAAYRAVVARHGARSYPLRRGDGEPNRGLGPDSRGHAAQPVLAISLSPSIHVDQVKPLSPSPSFFFPCH